MTAGWPLKPGAEATKPTSLTTRTTESIPTRASMAAKALRTQVRAATLPSSGGTSDPTLPLWVSSPDRNGSWPEVYTRLPVRTAGM